jgi:hypothetical protein
MVNGTTAAGCAERSSSARAPGLGQPAATAGAPVGRPLRSGPWLGVCSAEDDSRGMSRCDAVGLALRARIDLGAASSHSHGPRSTRVQPVAGRAVSRESRAKRSGFTTICEIVSTQNRLRSGPAPLKSLYIEQIQ